MGYEREKDFYSGKDPEGRRVFRYLKLYTKAFQWLPPPDKCPMILDLGCGPGLFAAFLAEKGYKSYTGIDFSPSLISSAMKNAPEYLFLYGDLRMTDTRRFLKQYKLVTALEFLEHINEDLSLLTELAPGTKVIASGPNYDSEGHVRFYVDLKKFIDRYSSLLNITQKAEIECSMNEGKRNIIYMLSGERK